jgi:hypothetical protein
MLQLSVNCGRNPSVPCHSDMLRHGRGIGHKSHDCLAIPGCPDCHTEFTRENLGDGYCDAWMAAMELWLVHMWTHDLVRVK